jgi:hypothetical protein
MDGHLHYPNDLDGPLNDPARTDYNNRPSNDISFIPAITSTSGCLHSEFVFPLYLHVHRETDRFFLHLQEFILHNLPVVSSTTAVR